MSDPAASGNTDLIPERPESIEGLCPKGQPHKQEDESGGHCASSEEGSGGFTKLMR